MQASRPCGRIQLLQDAVPGAARVGRLVLCISDHVQGQHKVCFLLSERLGALRPCGCVCYSTQRPRLLFPVSSVLAEDRARLCVFILFSIPSMLSDGNKFMTTLSIIVIITNDLQERRRAEQTTDLRFLHFIHDATRIRNDL